VVVRGEEGEEVGVVEILRVGETLPVGVVMGTVGVGG